MSMRSFLLAGLLVLCACSSGPGTTGAGGGAGSLELTDFCTKYLDAIGGQLSTCQSGPKELWVKTLSGLVLCDDIKKAVTAGRAAYDGASAQACLTSVASISCSTIVGGMADAPDCKKTLAGKVKVGEKCYGDGIDCGDDGYCSKASGACDGTCKARIAAGAACAIGDDCIKGYSCVNSVCTVDPPAGMVELGASCTGSSRCKPGLVCDSVTKNCANFIKEGQACVFGHNTCETFTSCGSANTCVRYAMPGGACGTTTMTTLYEYSGCVGAYCKIPTGMTTGTCTLRGATDAMCSNGDECTSGKCVSGKCAAACVVP